MAADELLGNSKFYLEIDGMTDLIVQKVSGLKIDLDAAGDMKAFGVTKGAKSAMQATVAGVTSATITVQFVATKEDQSLHDWYRASHSVGGAIAGGGRRVKGSVRMLLWLFIIKGEMRQFVGILQVVCRLLTKHRS